MPFAGIEHPPGGAGADSPSSQCTKRFETAASDNRRSSSARTRFGDSRTVGGERGARDFNAGLHILVREVVELVVFALEMGSNLWFVALGASDGESEPGPPPPRPPGR